MIKFIQDCNIDEHRRPRILYMQWTRLQSHMMRMGGLRAGIRLKLKHHAVGDKLSNEQHGLCRVARA